MSLIDGLIIGSMLSNKNVYYGCKPFDKRYG